MSTVKATNYLHLLDAARCKGDWEAVPELCRKVRKHATQRTCIALTAETEARLRHLAAPPNVSASTFASYVASLTELQEKLQPELRASDELKQLPSPAGGGESMVTTPQDILQARTVLAWIHVLKREWEPALENVPGEEEVGEGWDAGPGPTSSYMGVVRIQALVIRGIALSNIHLDPSASLQAFRAATRISNTFPSEQRSSVMFLIWWEKALSHYAQTAYRCWFEALAPGEDRASLSSAENAEESVGVAIGKTIVDEGTVATAFRRFNSLVSPSDGDADPEMPARLPEQSLTPDMHVERMEVFRNYYKFLSILLHPSRRFDHLALQRHAMSPTLSPRDNSSHTLNSEANENGSDSKIGSREQLRQELNDVGSVYERYLMRTLSFPEAEEYHEIVGEWVDQVMENWRASGGSGEDAPAVTQILYKAAMKTFHSPRILRHLFYTLTTVGNFDDAFAALHTYLDLIQKGKDRIAKGNVEKDFDPDAVIMATAVDGIRLMCRFGTDSGRPMKIAMQLEKWVEEWRLADREILSDVHRGIGYANATWAQRNLEPEDRQEALKAAVDAFKKGLGYDTHDVQAWYGLAFTESQLGRVEDATESARKGLGALQSLTENPDSTDLSRRHYVRNAVQLMHLLALLMTAKQDFQGAERVCMNAFDIVGEGQDALIGLGISDKVAVLELKMTHIALMEPIDGSEAAIPMTDELLSLYGTLFDGTHFVRQQPSEENAGQAQNQPNRPRTSSRASRLLHRNRKEPSIAGDASISDKSTSRTGSIIRKRPKSGNQSMVTIPDPVADAPQIHVTDANGGASPVSKSHRKLMRPSSVSGGTVRRMRSLGSMKSSATSVKDGYGDGVATPAMSSSTEISHYSPAPSEQGVNGRESHLFTSLKNKLHRHHHEAFDSTSGSANSTTTDVANFDGAVGTIPSRQDSFKEKDVPHNLPKGKLPYPLRTLGRSISEDGDGEDEARRNVRRPPQLPEPRLGKEEERNAVLGALRNVWLFVAGLYRRAGYLEDSAMAVEEATGLVAADGHGDGEADVFAERALLQLAHGDRPVAITLFEAGIAVDYDHPQAIIGLSALLLEMPSEFLTPLVPIVDTTRPPTPATASSTEMPRADNDGNEGQSTLEKVAARNRALGLLEKLVITGRGWDVAAAWYLLAQALIQAGEIERAKKALWRVVEIEDVAGVRRWSSCARGVI